jgi:hypothetical protein
MTELEKILQLTTSQKKAIIQFGKALKRLKNAKIVLIGMDDSLLYITEKASDYAKKIPNDGQEYGDPYKNGYQKLSGKTDAVGGWFGKPYADSGAW